MNFNYNCSMIKPYTGCLKCHANSSIFSSLPLITTRPILINFILEKSLDNKFLKEIKVIRIALCLNNWYQGEYRIICMSFWTPCIMKHNSNIK